MTPWCRSMTLRGRLLPGNDRPGDHPGGKKTHVLAVPIAAVLYRPLAARRRRRRWRRRRRRRAALLPRCPVAGAPGSKVTIWNLVAGKPVPLQVVIGLSDGKNLEITERWTCRKETWSSSPSGAAARNAADAVGRETAAGGTAQRDGSGAGDRQGRGTVPARNAPRLSP